jgi:carbon storage regulator
VLGDTQEEGIVMLVLSRKIGQSIVIDDDIVITVLDAGNGRVALGIQAPRERPVHRMEVYQAIQAELAEPRAENRDLCIVG